MQFETNSTRLHACHARSQTSSMSHCRSTSCSRTYSHTLIHTPRRALYEAVSRRKCSTLSPTGGSFPRACSTTARSPSLHNTHLRDLLTCALDAEVQITIIWSPLLLSLYVHLDYLPQLTICPRQFTASVYNLHPRTEANGRRAVVESANFREKIDKTMRSCVFLVAGAFQRYAVCLVWTMLH